MAIESAALRRPLHDDVLEAPFYIPATGPATRSRHVLKHDDTFVVLDSQAPRPVGRMGCFTVIPAFFPILNSYSMVRSPCRWRRTFAMTTRCSQST